MGEVYRARAVRLHRDVAVKVLPAPVVSDSERRARFQREAQVLAALNHANIAQIYGAEEFGGIGSAEDGPAGKVSSDIGGADVPADHLTVGGGAGGNGGGKDAVVGGAIAMEAVVEHGDFDLGIEHPEGLQAGL